MQNFGCAGPDFIPLREIPAVERCALVVQFQREVLVTMVSTQRPVSKPCPSEQEKAKASTRRPGPEPLSSAQRLGY